MSYVHPSYAADYDILGEDDAPLDAAELFEVNADAAVEPPDPALIAEMLADLNIGTTLHEHAEGERQLVGGIHLWGGVTKAMEETFPGWPQNSPDYDYFRARVLAALKPKSSANAAAVVHELFRREPQVAHDFHTFKAKSPFANIKQEQRFFGILKVMVKGVKYLSAQTRAKYKIELGAHLKRREKLFDTASLYNSKSVVSPAGSIGGAAIKGKAKRCIWVMTSNSEKEYEFYSHFGKLGRFHHSSFKGGGKVMAAGEWFVEAGNCTLISACSGHYQPEPWRFLLAFNKLNQVGAINQQTEIQVWDSNKAEQRKDALTFMNEFAKNLQTFTLYPPA